MEEALRDGKYPGSYSRTDLVSGFLEQGKGHGIVDGVAGGANHMFGRGIIDRAVVAQLVVEATQFGVLGRVRGRGVNAID